MLKSLIFAVFLLQSFIYAQGYQLNTLQSDCNLQIDLEELKKQGVKVLRYPIYLSYVPDLNEWVNKLKPVLEFSNKNKIRLRVAIHHPNRGLPLESEILDVQQFLSDWQYLSEQLIDYKFEPIVINEPRKLNNGIRLRELYNRARKVIKQRPIILAVNGTTSTSLRYWKKPNFRHITEVHLYDLSKFIFSGYNSYSSKRLDNILNNICSYHKKINPIYVGEIAVNRANKNANRYFRQVLKKLSDCKISWTVHAYSEAMIWNYKPSTAKVIAEYFNH